MNFNIVHFPFFSPPRAKKAYGTVVESRNGNSRLEARGNQTDRQKTPPGTERERDRKFKHREISFVGILSRERERDNFV